MMVVIEVEEDWILVVLKRRRGQVAGRARGEGRSTEARYITKWHHRMWKSWSFHPPCSCPCVTGWIISVDPFNITTTTNSSLNTNNKKFSLRGKLKFFTKHKHRVVHCCCWKARVRKRQRGDIGPCWLFVDLSGRYFFQSSNTSCYQ